MIRPWVFDANLAGSKSYSGLAATSATLKLTISVLGDEFAAWMSLASLDTFSLTGDGVGTYD